MNDTRDITVTVLNRPRNTLQPETSQDVIFNHDNELQARQSELEEAIGFLQLQVNDLKAKRDLLRQVGIDLAVMEEED